LHVHSIIFCQFFSWTNIIGGSPLLLDTFKLQVDNKSIETLAVDDWPRVPIKNIHIQKDRRKFDMEACISIMNRYRTSVETMVIKDLDLSLYEMERLLENMENLQILTFIDVTLPSETIKPLQLPKLTSLSITYSWRTLKLSAEILGAFKYNSLIETHAISNYNNDFLRGFIETLPKLKHLKLKGKVNNEVLLRSHLSQKLETLHIDSLNTDDNVQFLLNQTKLKELRLKRIPDVNSAAFVRTCYERLDTFYLDGALLIRNYQPQHVEEELQVDWIIWLEVLKRGLCECNL
jgi:hypothetical protein